MVACPQCGRKMHKLQVPYQVTVNAINAINTPYLSVVERVRVVHQCRTCTTEVKVTA